MNELTWVYLVRHGETDWNLLKRWQGQGITPLNPTGRRQAARVAARLAGDALSALYSSDSLRAWQTAEAIAAATGLPLRPDPRLRELDVGLWQGYATHEIEWLDSERYATRQADWLTTPCPEGESVSQLIARVGQAFDDITAAHPGERVAVVTHGGPIGAIRYLVNGCASTDLLNPWFYNTSVTLLRGRPGAWEIVLENDAAHLNHGGHYGQADR